MAGTNERMTQVYAACNISLSSFNGNNQWPCRMLCSRTLCALSSFWCSIFIQINPSHRQGLRACARNPLFVFEWHSITSQWIQKTKENSDFRQKWLTAWTCFGTNLITKIKRTTNSTNKKKNQEGFSFFSNPHFALDCMVWLSFGRTTIHPDTLFIFFQSTAVVLTEWEPFNTKAKNVNWVIERLNERDFVFLSHCFFLDLCLFHNRYHRISSKHCSYRSQFFFLLLLASLGA